MPRHFRLAALIAAATCLPASAQKGSWGDGHAAIYNAPIGYSAHADVSGAPKSATREPKATSPKAQGVHAANCAVSMDKVTSGVGAIPEAEQAADFPANPCTGFGGARLLANEKTASHRMTVTTTGAWNTVIVESRHVHTNDQPTTLNGGLNLD